MAGVKLPKVKTPAQMKAEMAVGRARTVLPKAERDINLGNMLRESAVKDPMYHASKADINTFSPEYRTELSSMGHHFGTADQANFRTDQYDFSGDNVNIGKYYLNIKNPLETTHMGSFAPDHLAEQMMDLGILDPDKYDALSSKFDYQSVPIGTELVKILKKNGYDGLKYANEREGEGFSYVPFESTQIKSAIGNEGTYDASNPDITKAHGGIVKMSKGGLKPVKAPKVSAPKVESPTVMKRSDVSDLFRLISEREGSYGAKRVERAADEIPRLGEMYTQDALRSAFSGDNAQGLVIMNPKNFEDYAVPLPLQKDIRDLHKYESLIGDPSAHFDKYDLSTNDYVKHLSGVQNKGGFDAVPYLNVFSDEVGLGLNPKIVGHEGRHRNRALAAENVPSGLVILRPSGDLREGLPRRHRDDYIEALRKEFSLAGNKVLPQTYTEQNPNSFDETLIRRPPIKISEPFANGGAVKMRDGGDPDREFIDRMREEFSVYNKPTYGNEIPGTPTIDQQRYELTRQGQREAENRARTTRDNLTAMDPSGTLGIVDALKTVGKAVVAPIAYVGGNAFDWLQTGKLDPSKMKSRGEKLEKWMTPKTEEGGEILEEIGKVGPAITGSEMGFGMHPNLWASGIGLTTPKQTAAGLRLGSERVAPFAKDVGSMASELYASGKIPGMVSPNAYVVKPKGGNWLGEGVDATIEPLKVRLNDRMISGEMINEMAGEDLWSKIVSDGKQGSARHWLHANRPDVFDKIYGRESIPINNWLDTKLKKYIKNEMGTPDDPIRKLADQGKLHTSTDEFPNIMDDEFTDVFSQGYIGERRKAAGFPTESYADTFEGKNWEASTDMSINRKKAKTLLKQADSPAPAESIKDLVDANPWLRQADPDTPIYDLDRSRASDLGFSHIVDELKNAMRIDSDLPEKLRIEPSKLEKMTVPQVVERVSEINAWRAENQAAANEKIANNAASQLVKEYPDQGYKWVELRKPDDLTELPEGYTVEPYKSEYSEGVKILRPDGTQASSGDTVDQALKNMSETILDDALRYEGDTMGHCVGSYCSDVMSGETRIYSLRDSKGQPHVTIEVQPNPNPYAITGQDFSRLSPAEKAEYGEHIRQWRRRNPDVEELTDDNINEALRDAGVPPRPDSIIQIKGKGNAKPKDTYLPFVQDFVKSGKWSEINDFKNTGLVRAGLTGKLMTPDEHAKWLARGDNAPPDGMKHGGKVQFAKSLDAMRHELTKAK